MKLTIIIPVYKAENTLNRCVESVLSQDIADMEVILIDDGSPDNCGILCDEWASKDQRISVIHQANRGVSVARNAALDIVKSEYVTFVDSDDYLLEDTFAPLMQQLTDNPDIDILEYAVKYEGFKHHDWLILPEKIFTSANDYWHNTKGWNHCYMCNKIFRTTLFERTRFEEGQRLEDMLILPHIYKKQPTIATTPHGTYCYVRNHESFSNDTSPKAIYQLLRAEWLSAWHMHTLPCSKNGSNLYYYMCCRIYDIIRFSLRDLTNKAILRK